MRLLVIPTLDVKISRVSRGAGTDITGNVGALEKLKRGVKKVKPTFSCQQSTRLVLERFNLSYDFSKTLARAKFQGL